MRRSTLCLVGFVVGLFAIGEAGAASRPGRGSKARLAQAAKLRAVRAGLMPTAVHDASQGSFAELQHLVMPNQRTVSAYVPYDRLVFLADGLPQKWDALAEPIHGVFPDKTIVKGDYEIMGEHHADHYTAKHMDHTRALPLASGSADLVLMRRGLCLCHGAKTCGGLAPEVPTMRRFFADVYRVLDPHNPRAVAYLHGSYGPRDRVDVFRQAADEAMARDPRMKIEFVERADTWHAARITHAADVD